MLDRVSLLLGWTFWVGLVVAGVGWIVAVLAITDSEHKRLYQYAITGFRPPIVFTFFLLLIQRYT